MKDTLEHVLQWGTELEDSEQYRLHSNTGKEWEEIVYLFRENRVRIKKEKEQHRGRRDSKHRSKAKHKANTEEKRKKQEVKTEEKRKKQEVKTEEKQKRYKKYRSWHNQHICAGEKHPQETSGKSRKNRSYKSSVVWQLITQLDHSLSVDNNVVPFHLWRKKTMPKNEKVSK